MQERRPRLGRPVSVILDENDAPGAVLLPGGAGAVRIARVLDRWPDPESPRDGGGTDRERPECRENWLVATDRAAASAPDGIFVLQHSGRAEWRLYGWPGQ